MSVFRDIVADVKLPKMIKVKQLFDRPKIDSIANVIKSEFARPEIANSIKEGISVAITCGSRGVANIALITKLIVLELKKRGAKPFVVPAMGSHGGGTAEGQKSILTDYGVTEDYIGCAIKSSMEVKHIGYTSEGHKVLIDKNAAEADSIIIVNRIKAHTEFRGHYESGLMKMMAIGLGKQQGAEICHASGFKHMAKMVPLFGNAILENANIILGVGIIENAYDETSSIKAMLPEEIIIDEPKYLIEAKKLMAKIWIEDIDVLIVDRIGKDISGNGADPNITGRFATPYASGGIKAQKAVVLDLTEKTHGNATGIGVFDSTTRRLFEKISFEMTYPNAITCTVLNVANIPVVMDSDKDAIAVLIKTCIEIDKENPRIIRIADTKHLEEIYVSAALIEEVKQNPHMQIMGELQDWVFDSRGNIL